MIDRTGIHRSFIVLMVLFFSLALYPTPVSAAAPLCGDGSAPDYGFTTDLQQAHWTVGWQGYVSQQTVDEVDSTLDQLNNDSIAQTMILNHAARTGRQPRQLRCAFSALYETWSANWSAQG